MPRSDLVQEWPGKAVRDNLHLCTAWHMTDAPASTARHDQGSCVAGNKLLSRVRFGLWFKWRRLWGVLFALPKAVAFCLLRTVLLLMHCLKMSQSFVGESIWVNLTRHFFRQLFCIKSVATRYTQPIFLCEKYQLLLLEWWPEFIARQWLWVVIHPFMSIYDIAHYY